MSLFRRSLAPGLGSSVPTRERAVRLPLTLTVAAWLVRRAARVLWWLLRHPDALALLVGVGGLWWLFERVGWGPLAAGGGVLVVSCLLWAPVHPPSFDRFVETPVRSRWRFFWIYRREWQPACVTAGLAKVYEQAEHLPALVQVRSTAVTDEVLVRMLPGQTVEDWSKASERLAQTFGSRDCRAYPVPRREHLVALRLPRTDPLADVSPRPTLEVPGDGVDLAAIPVGVTEDGEPFTLPVRTERGATHLLIAGETGAGKSSAVWSLIAGLTPAVRAGRVRLWAVDPKAMELAAGRRLFDRYCRGTPHDIADLLEMVVMGMRSRMQALDDEQDDEDEATRKLEATAKHPLLVVLLDEMAWIPHVPDAALRRRIVGAIWLVLQQGRAPGVSLIGCTQDARKETLTMRDGFPYRVALRTAEAEQADMILGRGARERGARTDWIDPKTPGVAYVVADGDPTPVRVRFWHVDDRAIAALAAAGRGGAA